MLIKFNITEWGLNVQHVYENRNYNISMCIIVSITFPFQFTTSVGLNFLVSEH